MPSACAPDISTLVLESTERAPLLARRFLAERFCEWGISEDYVARVVISELVTNAYLHGVGPIIVRAFRDKRDGLPVIEVWDKSEAAPIVRTEDDLGESGRGLLTVENLVESWGTRSIAEGGKIVWAKCRF
jgi:anti-sigma regulatory factor (Ser/Thr protein kinase)